MEQRDIVKLSKIISHRLVQNAAFLILAQVIKLLARGTYVVLLAFYLGPELLGLLNYSHHWYVIFFPLAVFGMPMVLSHDIGRYVDSREQKIRVSVASRLLTTIAATTACLGIVLVTETEPQARELICILTFALVARSFSTWGSQVCVVMESAAPIPWITAIWRLTELFAAWILLHLDFSVITLAWLHVATYVGEAMTFYILLRRRRVSLRPLFDTSQIRRFLELGALAGGAGFFQGLFHTAPVLLFRWLGGFGEQLGNVSLVFQMLSMLLLFPKAINKALLTRMSRKDQSSLKRRDIYLRFLSMYGTPTLFLGCLFTSLVGVPIAQRFISSEYALMLELTQIAIWGLIPVFWALSAHQILGSQAYFFQNAVTIFVAVAATTMTIALGYSSFGVLIVAYAYLVGSSSWAIVGWLFVLDRRMVLRR